MFENVFFPFFFSTSVHVLVSHVIPVSSSTEYADSFHGLAFFFFGDILSPAFVRLKRRGSENVLESSEFDIRRECNVNLFLFNSYLLRNLVCGFL